MTQKTRAKPTKENDVEDLSFESQSLSVTRMMRRIMQCVPHVGSSINMINLEMTGYVATIVTNGIVSNVLAKTTFLMNFIIAIVFNAS